MLEDVLLGFVGGWADAQTRLSCFVERMEQAKLTHWFVRRHSSEGQPMENIFNDWLADPCSPILRITGESGAGKSTLGSWLFLDLAEKARLTPADRIPVEQSFDSLVSFLRNADARDPVSPVANPSSTKEGTRLEEVVIFVDGHDAPLAEFDLDRLAVAGGKIVILQTEMDLPERPALVPFSPLVAYRGRITVACLRNFTREEMRDVVTQYFPIAVELHTTGSAPARWKEARMASLLSGDFDELLLKPQVAHRLCRIAADQSVELKQSDTPGHWIFRSFPDTESS